MVVEPVVNMRKLLELLELQTEGPTVDYKELYDLRKDAPLRKRHLVELAKHVGAMSVQGGFLVVGVDDQGVPTGALSVEQADYFDEARLRPMLLTWLPKTLEIRSQKHQVDGKTVVLIYVARNPAGFAVFEAGGQYGDGKRTTTVFSKGDIFWRDGTQSCRIDQRGLEQIIVRARPADAPSPLPEIAVPAGTAQPGVTSGTDISVFQPPRTRNLHFAGREDKLAQLDATLSSGSPAAILQAISGLGGIGKTELAIEYAHRRRDLYDLVFTLHAGTEATLLADMRVLAGKVGLSQAWDGLRERVLQWLSQRGRWLLILDNAAALSSVADYVPEGPGHILITSRDRVWRQRAAIVELDVWRPRESVQFLSSRLGRWQAFETVRAEDLADLLGHFPLALEQAAAFMEETSTSYVEYLDLFARNSGRLLGFGVPVALEYGESVATTWRITFDAVPRAQPAAMELLELCSFLAPDSIPEEILSRGGTVLPGTLSMVVSDGLLFHEVLGLLARYGLIRRSSGFLSMHRLVQHVVRMSISRDQAKNRVATCVHLLQGAFSGDRGEPTDQARNLLLAHIFAVFPHAVSIDAELEAAKNLLMSAAEYMGRRAQLLGAAASVEDAVTMTSEIYGSNAPQVIHSLRAAGQVLRDMGNLPGARACFERALAMEEEYRGD